MRHTVHFALSASLCLGAMAQNTAAPTLTEVPPKPTCHWIFNTGPCADMWRTYNQAMAQRQREELQLYVNRQKALASSQATAPLQQQIADLNKLAADQQEQIRKLQEQIQADAAQSQERMKADAATALQAKAAAHKQGLELGAGIGAGATLLLLGAFFGIKRLTRSLDISRKSVGGVASV
jgi:biopolymer transport protein ExbB/TolQ